jgi:DNA-binding response OmpR family regulator
MIANQANCGGNSFDSSEKQAVELVDDLRIPINDDTAVRCLEPVAAMPAPSGFSGFSSYCDTMMVIKTGQLEIPEDQYRVIARGRSIRLTTAEYRVLWKLASHSDAIVEYALLDRGDRSDRAGNRRAVQAIVASLRRKLSRYGCRILTARDFGYMLKSQT